MTKNNRNFEHSKKERGSIRVWKADIFYEDKKIDCEIIKAGKLTARITPSCATKELRAIFDSKKIEYTPSQYDGKGVKEEVEGLDFDSINAIKGDKEHLRIKYSAWNVEDLEKILFEKIEWLDQYKVAYGEPDGSPFCIRGACYTSEELKRKKEEFKQKRLQGFTN